METPFFPLSWPLKYRRKGNAAHETCPYPADIWSLTCYGRSTTNILWAVAGTLGLKKENKKCSPSLMLRTYIQLYAKAEGQSAALKKQHFPLGIQSAKKSHNLNNSENEIVTIFPLMWDTSLTTRICERLFIQNLDFMLFV